MHTPSLTSAPLGQEVSYPKNYDPTLLFPIARDVNRQALDLPTAWYGADIWNAYEVSWLNNKGKPIVALARFTFPHTSPQLVESKSFKLYLNSFNEERYGDIQTVRKTMAQDLSHVAGMPVGVELQPLGSEEYASSHALDGICIDDADIEISDYAPKAGLLRCTSAGATVSETLMSDLLKSNCPVTGQPDWGSVQIRYTGPQIDRDSLLRYVVSLRLHTEFHEHCVEKMYCDLWHACRPESLLVYARYTRRGGLDINPWRSSEPADVSNTRTPRQ